MSNRCRIQRPTTVLSNASASYQDAIGTWDAAKWVTACTPPPVELAASKCVAQRTAVACAIADVTTSDVIAQHQLARMWLEVSLAGEIRDAVDADMMAKQCERHDERHEAGAILLD